MLKKPNSKTIGSAALAVGAGVAGAKLSDGIVAIMPESTTKYKKILVAAGAVIVAAAVDGKTTTGQAVQAALVGAAIKQGADYATEMLATTVDPKDNATVSGRFVNAVVGHSTFQPVATPIISANPTARLGNPTVEWAPAMPVERPMAAGV
ncbi:hypothetical protein FLJC2902T_17450 [Flavobacterium limnosediminis JC2902]|uniref:Uncharacterized protein n=1 Tax=Flavobacterium limnosediminis JC2902 TaxID=1341181 RepID=V6SVD3_9FLAO|nr:hypothetical protein [Flavobacterium limnosediminis]ESU28390.1 hypothetical protein FLJC2902T_17450 [Flavobacterium limnosediminis JC2902]